MACFIGYHARVDLIQMNHLGFWYWFGMTAQLAEIEVIIGSEWMLLWSEKSMRITICVSCQNVTQINILSFSADQQIYMTWGEILPTFKLYIRKFPLLFRPLPLFATFQSPLLAHNSPSKMIKRWSVRQAQPTIGQIVRDFRRQDPETGWASSVDLSYCGNGDRVILWIRPS